MIHSGTERARTLRRQRAIIYLLICVILAGAAIFLGPPLVSRLSGVLRARGESNRVYLPEMSPGSPQARPILRVAATATPGLVNVIPPLSSIAGPELQAKIEIVWPHGGAATADADLANITVYLLNENGVASVACSADPVVRLWAAQDMQAARPIAVGQKRMFSGGGRTFPVWDFNDVDVSAARDSAVRLKFYATVDGAPALHNVWVHGADSRTVFPRADEPVGVTVQRPEAVEARVEILWPHDNLPPELAHVANVTVYLFDAASGHALSPQIDWTVRVRLHWALNNDADAGAASTALGLARSVTTSNGVGFLAWDFNDLDISPGLDSLNKMHFWVTVDDVPTFTNIWTHGAVAATIFPQADVPLSCQ